jgi:hypothetical protein
MDNRTFLGILSIIVTGIVWVLVYAIPSPDYNVRYVEKKIPVYRDVVRYAGIKTVVKEATFDERFKYCMSEIQKDMDRCLYYANIAKQPRIIEKRVNVPVYSGVRVVDKPADYVQEAHWCYEKTNGGLSDCMTYAQRAVEAKPRVIIRNVIKEVPVYKGEKIIIQKDAFLTIFKYCNENFTINVGGAAGGQIRNQRLAICKDVALSGGAK